MARSSSSRADDHDRLRLLATPSPRTSGAEKKESTDRRLSQACQRCATPSSISYFDRHLSDAHTAEDEAVKSRSNKSAKVVLGFVTQFTSMANRLFGYRGLWIAAFPLENMSTRALLEIMRDRIERGGPSTG